MKLIYRVLVRLSLALAVVLAVWGSLFYLAIVDEVNDEVDDSLEDYSENIIIRALAEQNLPSRSDGTNNSYYLTRVSESYAEKVPHIRYSDEMVYIEEKKETEPARVLKTIFKDKTGQFFELTVSTPAIEKEDLQEAILNWIILLYIGSLFIVLAINIWIFYGNMRPLYVLLKWLDQYTIGKENIPPDLKTDITEFKKLHEAAVRSVYRNQAVFEQQKQFIGNASHELQTPLAICRNRLEMLVENEVLSEAQLQEITKVQQTLSYIIRLNKSLLFLSKIENGQYQDNREICLNNLVRSQLEDYREIYAYKKITIQVEEKGEFRMRMDETLAIALITNLLKNAYTHNIPGGTIQICLAASRLTFRNTGIPAKLDGEKIFQRFYQEKNSKGGSAGLGLSIVQAICKIYRLQIRYAYDSGLHCFEVEKEERSFQCE